VQDAFGRPSGASRFAPRLGAAVRTALRRFGNPTRVLIVTFAGLITAGTLLLWLPLSAAPGRRTGIVDALFTATSAVCVTGLSVLDTELHWSTFGKAVILALIQLGGLGIVTLATLVFLSVSDRLGIAHLRALSAEVGVEGFSDLARLVRLIVVLTLASEAVFATILGLRFWITYDYGLTRAIGHGVFHAVSAWNNAGFGLLSDNMTRFVTDPVVTLAICGAVVLGGLGFPVLRVLGKERFRFDKWSLHAKLTVATTLVLLVVGSLAFLAFEWENPATMGQLAVHEKVNAAVFQGVQPRTAGFNTVDVGGLEDESLLVTMALMLIGGGSASTAGGMKVTTFALLGFVMWAEIRGDRDVSVFRRRVPTSVQRQALTVALAGVGIVLAATLVLIGTHDFGLEASAFEAVSALGTVGLSTGITAAYESTGKLVLVVLMFLGRLGPITLAAALALRSHPNLFRFPEDRPLIG
jgi:potassium uptake TrkH family protein